MTESVTPKAPCDVLTIPSEEMPETVRALVRARALSPLMRNIHLGMGSTDPEIRQQSVQALRHLGFPE